MNEYVLVFTNKWTDSKRVHPTIFSLKEAEKKKASSDTTNERIEIKELKSI